MNCSATHTGVPYRNFLAGSLQLVAWLFFRPAAWADYIGRIDPSLRPAFALVELRWRQWRTAGLRRLLLQGYVVWILIAVLGALLTTAEISGRSLAGGNEFISMSAMLGMFIAVAVSLPLGITLSVAVAVLAGSVSAIAMFVDRGMAAKPSVESLGVGAVGLAFGLASGFSACIRSTSRTGGLLRQISGVVLAGPFALVGYVLAASVCALIVGVVTTVAYWLVTAIATKSAALEILFGNSIGLITGEFTLSSFLGVEPQEMVLLIPFFGTIISVLYLLAERLVGRLAGAFVAPLAFGLISVLQSLTVAAFLIAGVGLGLMLAAWRLVASERKVRAAAMKDSRGSPTAT